MSEAKFTKGEWEVNDEGSLIEIKCNGDVIGTVYGYDPDNTGFNICDTAHSNAHLMATSTGMYAMLKRILENQALGSPLALSINNLLAKARGEQQ